MYLILVCKGLYILLVHICCAVDSHYFLEKIQEEYPDEKLIGYFYDPNIHPYSEYRLRYLDVEYSCQKLGIKLIEGAYNLEEWLKKVKGMEHLPEKGDRCTVCYDDRLDTTVQKAIELGHNKFTTTLLISPKKSQEKLEKNNIISDNKLNIVKPIISDISSISSIVFPFDVQYSAINPFTLFTNEFSLSHKILIIPPLPPPHTISIYK